MSLWEARVSEGARAVLAVAGAAQIGPEGTCQPLKAAGSPCNLGSECATRYCGGEKTCDAEPVCVQ